MDISSIGDAGILRTEIDIKTKQAQTESFEAILKRAAGNNDEKELKKACVEFESYFLSLIFKEMRKTVDGSNGVLPKSQAEEIFQEMLDDEYSKTSANSGGIGLAEMLYRQMSSEIKNSDIN